MTLEEGVARLLERCDREDQNPKNMRYLYTDEIRRLLGLPGYEVSYGALADEVRKMED